MCIYCESTIYLNKMEGINNIKEFFTRVLVAYFVQKNSTFTPEMLCSFHDQNERLKQWVLSLQIIVYTNYSKHCTSKSQRVKIYKIYFLDLGGSFFKLYFLFNLSQLYISHVLGRFSCFDSIESSMLNKQCGITFVQKKIRTKMADGSGSDNLHQR